jgi:multidrug efflux pump subunit AcrB
MSTIKPRNEDQISFFGRLQQSFSRGFESSIISVYRPFLDICIRNQLITLVTAIAIFTVAMSSMNNGWLRTSFFPEFEDNAIFINLAMPATTGYETTKEHVEKISNIAGELSKEYVDAVTGESYFKYFVAVAGLSFGPAGPSFGTNYGTIIMEFEQGPSGYPEGFSIKKVQDQMRERIGDIPGAEKLSLSSSFNDFGKPLSVAIYGNDIERIDGLVGQIREYLKSYPGVFDIQDNFTSGKEEIKMSLTPLANALGIPQTEIASQVRDAVFGFEAQRIQRGTDEIKVMVRYPLIDRSSVSDLAAIKITTANSNDTIPLSELATLSSGTSPTSIYRDRLRRAVTVSADIDSTNYDVAAIRTDLRLFLAELFASEAELSFDMDGQAETQKETAESFLLGFILVIIVIYALLAIPFKSFGQPLVVMSIIPLAIVGAIAGHYIMGLAFSMLSIMGILGLTGIVVNDSLVLVDYINQQRAKGMDVMEAVLTAGETRFRPVMLTSLTTFVGLLPLMLNQSTQAQSLIPMAVSLGFGIIFATLITLVITPINYLAGRHVKHSVISGARWLSQAWLRYWHKEDSNPSS